MKSGLKTIWSYSLLSVLVLAAAGTPMRSQRPPDKLNVLFIAVDDLNTELGCYGNPVVKSPNIDRLASRGVRFDRAYCQYPLCNPSRTSLLSGRRPDTTRIMNNTTDPRTSLKDVVFLPEYFRKHGYLTARVGKIAHGTFEEAVTWDVSESAQRPGAGGRPRAGRKQQQGPAEPTGAMKLQWEATNNRDEDEPDGRTARRIVRLLEENKDRPFFIGAGFHKPHLPWIAPKKYSDMYTPDQTRSGGLCGRNGTVTQNGEMKRPPSFTITKMILGNIRISPTTRNTRA